VWPAAKIIKNKKKKRRKNIKKSSGGDYAPLTTGNIFTDQFQ